MQDAERISPSENPIYIFRTFDEKSLDLGIFTFKEQFCLYKFLILHAMHCSLLQGENVQIILPLHPLYSCLNENQSLVARRSTL